MLLPAQRRLAIYRSIDDVTALDADGTPTCDDLLPGFALPPAQVFGDPPAG